MTSIARRRRRRSIEEKRRDLRARLFGIAYLVAGAVAAVVHDALAGLAPGRFAHDCEQMSLAATLILTTFGVMLLVDGRRVFEDSLRNRHRVSNPEPRAAGTDGALLDTRAGVAMLLARKAIGGGVAHSDPDAPAGPAGPMPAEGRPPRGR